MNEINKRQNAPLNLKYLAAQRVLYARAKKMFGYQILLTVILSVVFSFLKLIPKENLGFELNPYIAFASIIISFSDVLFFNTYISGLRTNAAKIQELFDCNLFDLPWNESNSGSKPEKYIIEENSLLYVQDDKTPLENWYDIDIESLSKERAILMCQETNLFYDGQLREGFKNANIVLCIILIIISFIVALITNIKLSSFITTIILPILPMIVITIKIIMENEKSLRTSIELRKIILRFKDRNFDPKSTELRQIQDKIYCSRKDSSLVPEFYYKRRRKKLEKAMKVNAT